MMKRISVVLFLTVLVFSLYAQDSLQARQYIRDLTAPAMHGRGYAYNGDSIAAEYLRQQFKTLGLEPFADNYYHHYDFDVYAMEGPVSASLNGRELKAWDEFSIAPMSHSANETFTLLAIPAKTLLDKEALGKFYGKHAKVIANSLLYVDLANCKDKEAALRNYGMMMRFSVNNGRLPFKGIVAGVENIPVWSFNFAHEPCDYVVAYVKADLMTKKKARLSLSYTNEIKNHKTQNVCAMVRGVGAPDSLVIVGGHYDHLGQMGDVVMFPGAHDNASGTATVLDLARYFKNHPPYYTMLFVLFSGEEAGLLGSLAFVKDSLFDFSKVKMMLNIDLMGGGDDGFTVVNSDADNTKDFFQSMVDMNEREHLVKEVKPRKNANISDHAPFILKGMPAVFVYTMGGKTGGYHQPDDTNENCSLSAYENIVKIFIRAIEEVKNER